MFRKMIIMTCISTCCMLAGCASSMQNPSADKNLAKLLNKNWVLTEINQVNYKATPTQSAVPHLTFNNNQLSGSDGCNQFIGGYAVKGSGIKFSNLATTEKICLTATDLPQKFSQALLDQVVSYEATDTELKLIDNNHRVVLRFENIK